MHKTRPALINMLCTLMLCNATVFAEEKQTAQLDWWQHSSLASGMLSENLLSHMEFVYSHMETSGNSEGFQYSGSTKLILRKHTVSSISAYDIFKGRTTTFVGGKQTTKKDRQDAHQSLIFDLTKSLSMHAGAMYNTDLTKYIDTRYTYYSGLQYNLVNHPEYIISLAVFAGYDDTSYMNDELQKLVSDVYVPDYESGVIQLVQSIRWKARDNVTISESIKYMSFFDDSEYARWDFEIETDITITKHLSLTARFASHYDDNVFAEVAEPFGYEKRDTALATGIKLSF